MRRLAAFVLLGSMACGGDSNTEPSPTANVSGTWNASVSNLSGSGIACSSVGNTQLTLNQTGDTFSGTYSGGELTCTGPGGTASAPFGSGTVINGTVSGSDVSFDIDTPDQHFTGTASSTSMSGTTRWNIDLGAPTGVVTLNGNWGAAKQ